jgi:hypothetical protein
MAETESLELVKSGDLFIDYFHAERYVQTSEGPRRNDCPRIGDYGVILVVGLRFFFYCHCVVWGFPPRQIFFFQSGCT